MFFNHVSNCLGTGCCGSEVAKSSNPRVLSIQRPGLFTEKNLPSSFERIKHWGIMNIEKLYFELKVRRLILGSTSCHVCLCYCVSVSATSTHLELHQWTCGTEILIFIHVYSPCWNGSSLDISIKSCSPADWNCKHAENCGTKSFRCIQTRFCMTHSSDLMTTTFSLMPTYY